MFVVARARIVCFCVIAASIVIGVFIALAGAPASSAGIAREFLVQNGWEVNESPMEQASVAFPQVFDAVYEGYNRLQREAGFDLTPYKGERAERVTFLLLNYDGAENVRANVLVHRRRVIGGDISTVAIDGFMLPLGARTKGEEKSATIG